MMLVIVAAAMALAGSAPAERPTAVPQPSVITPTSPIASDAATRAAALELARLLYTEEAQIAAGLRLLDQSVIPAFRKDENFKTLERDYPGLISALGEDLRPLFERSIRKDLPEYHRRVAEIIAGKLNVDEIRELAAFYASPTGRKLLRVMLQNYTGDATIREAMADPDKPSSLAAVQQDHKAAVASVAGTLSDEDKQALIELAKKPYASRLASLGPDVRKLELDMANAPDPALDAEMETVMTASMTRHMAKFDEAKGRK